MSCFYIRYPIPDGLVDRIFKRFASGRDRDDLRSEEFHPEHIERLPLDILLSQETSLPIRLDDDPLTCVVRGTGRILDDPEKYQAVLTT